TSQICGDSHSSPYEHAPHRHPHSIPTRRSSDLLPPSNREQRSPVPPLPGAKCRCLADKNQRRVHERMPRSSRIWPDFPAKCFGRSEEHTSELQSRGHLVCRLLLEKKNNNTLDEI